MKFYQRKRFKELEEEWDKKLSEAGFQDIEKKTKNDRKLKQFSQMAYGGSTERHLERNNGREAYYDLLREGFAKEVFLEYTVMQKFVFGMSRIDILKELLSQGFRVEYETIRYIIRRYEYLWGIKHYTLKQMNLRKPPTRL